jgi:hypothetical protein
MFLMEMLSSQDTWEYIMQVSDRLKLSSGALVDSVEMKDAALSQELKALFADAFCLIDDAFCLDSSNLPPSDALVDFDRKIWACETGLQKLELIKIKAKGLLIEQDLVNLQAAMKFFQMTKDLSVGFKLLREGNFETKFVQKLHKYLEGLIVLNPATLYNLSLLIQDSGSETEFPPLVKQCVDAFSFIANDAKEVADYALRKGGLSPSNFLELAFYSEQIKSIAEYTQSDVDLLRRGVQPIGLIFDEVDGKQIVINPNSAEGKAIQRSQEPYENIDWITYVEPDEQIDVDDLKSQLRACGYIE